MTRLYVGQLSYDCREKDLDRLFSEFGDLRDVVVKNGYGFVEFRDVRDAEDAVRELDRRDFLGRRITVEFARDRRESRRRSRSRSRSRGRGGRYSRSRSPRRRPRAQSTKYRLIVSGLPRGCSWQDLKDHFRRVAEVSYADVKRDNDSEGVVDFHSRDDMFRVLDEMDGTEIRGEKIRLAEAFKEDRGGDRSRSPAPRRSRSPRKDSPSPDDRGRSPAREASPAAAAAGGDGW